MQSYSDEVLITLIKTATRYRKPYCFPSQAHILRLLAKYHQVIISRRTLNRILDRLESSGYFSRIRRHHSSKEGKIIFASTLYKFKKKMYNFMGFLSETTRKFFSLFRVPKLAQYDPFGVGRSNNPPVDNSNSSGEAPSEGGRSAPFFKFFRA
jgi:hypothetical protein